MKYDNPSVGVDIMKSKDPNIFNNIKVEKVKLSKYNKTINNAINKISQAYDKIQKFQVTDKLIYKKSFNFKQSAIPKPIIVHEPSELLPLKKSSSVNLGKLGYYNKEKYIMKNINKL